MGWHNNYDETMGRNDHKKALVVGSNSFLARALSEQLVAKGHHVTGVYHSNKQHLLATVRQVPYSALDRLESDYDWVFIVAAYIPKKTDEHIEEKLQKTNIDLVVQLIQRFSKARIIFCSSVSVYGPSPGILKETSGLHPTTLYGKSKVTAEERVSESSSYAIVRFSSLFGCRMRPTTFLPLIIKDALSDARIRLFGTGARKQNYIAVVDAAKYLVKAAEAENNGVYLAVSEQSISNLEAAQVVQTLLPNTTIAFAGKDSAPSFFYDNTMTRKTLGIVDHIPFKNAIDILIECLKKEL